MSKFFLEEKINGKGIIVFTFLEYQYKTAIMIIERNVYKKLCDEISRPEISVLLGPRQVGKTFDLFDKYKKKDTGNFNTLLEEYLTIGGLAGLIHHNDFEQKIR